MRSALFLCFALMTAGCVSSRPPSPHTFQGERDVEAMDASIKGSHDFWNQDIRAKTGADTNGFTVVEYLGSVQKIFTVEARGKLVTYNWDDVDEVSIRVLYANVLFCGLLDPTGGSCVRLKFHDGTMWDIHTKKISMSFFPFWLFSTELARANQVGSVAKSLVDLRRTK